MSTTLPCHDVVFRRPRLTKLLTWLGVLLIVVGLPCGAAFLGWAGVFMTIGAAMFSWVQATTVHRRRRYGGTITLEPGGLRVVEGGGGEAHDLLFSAIESGYVVPSDSAAVLILRNGSELSVRLEGDGPSRVLAHARVDPTQRVLAMPLRRTLGAFTIGFVSFWPLLLGSILSSGALLQSNGWSVVLGIVLAALSTGLVVRRYGFPRVIVGADGIRVLGVLRPRFIAHETIGGVELVPSPYGGNTPPSIRVLLRGQPALVLPTVAASREQIEGLAARINDTAEAHATGGARRLDTLARGTRSIQAWRDDVARMALAPPGFRDQSLGREDFEHVLADAAAPTEQRIGAALALRALDPGGAPARIRIAAEASADDALREVLTLASEGEIDDAMLVRASARKASR